MNKRLNYLILSGLFICISLLGISRYHYSVYEKQIIATQNDRFEHEYRHRLKDMNLELKKIIQKLNDSDEKDISNYIREYKHKFIIFSDIESTNTLKKSFNINGKIYFISITDDSIQDILESYTKDFLNNYKTLNNGYIWISEVFDFQGGENYAKRLIHTNLKDTESMMLSTNIKDTKGNKPYLEELNGITKNNEIYFESSFKIINSNEVSERINYSRLYEKRNWIVSAQLLQSSLDKIINEGLKESNPKYISIEEEIVVIEILVILLLLIMFFLSRNKTLNYFNKNQDMKRRVEDKLEKTENNAERFFSLSINLHIIADTQGKIIQINYACESILGYKREELTNKSIFNYVHPDDIENTINEMAHLEQGKVVYYFENRYKHKNGNYITLAWSANADTQNNIIYASAQDITSAKSSELERKRQDKVIQQQSKMAIMGEMIAVIAHQWRQPLAKLNGLYLNMEIDFHEKKLNQELFNKYLLQMENTSMYLSTTINDFSNFFKIEKEKEEFEINDILIKSDSMISQILDKQDIKIILDTKEEITLKAYPSELMQVIFTIINNAKDAFKDKEITEKLIKISSYQNNECIFLSFEDNAGGIKETLLEKIFEPYFTTKYKSEGTGLGLYIAKSVIEKSFKGELNVENTKNGAMFTIKLYKEYL